MCAVSMITDHYRDRWPMLNKYQALSSQQFPPPIQITTEQWNEYLELKRRAQEYDARTNQADCAKPDVEEWEKKVESYLIKKGLLTDVGNRP